MVQQPARCDQKFFILGLHPDKYHASNKDIAVLNLCLLLAKIVISLSWKETSKPKFSTRIRELSMTLPLQKMTYITYHIQYYYYYCLNFVIFKMSDMLDNNLCDSIFF